MQPAAAGKRHIEEKEMMAMLTCFSRPFVLYLLLLLLLAHHLYHMAFGAVSGVAGLIDGYSCRTIEP
jgi:hypothetical protein